MKSYKSKEEEYEISLYEGFKKERIVPFHNYFRLKLIQYGKKYHDLERVEDSIQDVFEALTYRLRTNKLPKKIISIKAYLFKSFDYVYRNQTKRYKKEFAVSKLDKNAQREFQQFSDEFLNPIWAIDGANDVLSRAYNSLPYRYKKIILLRSIRGYRYKEIAQILKLQTPSAAESMFRRAIKQFTAMWKKLNR